MTKAATLGWLEDLEGGEKPQGRGKKRLILEEADAGGGFGPDRRRSVDKKLTRRD